MVQTNSTQSAKICLNLHFQRGGVVVVQTNSIQSAKICISREGGVVVAQTNSTQSAKICPNLHFRGCGGPDQLNPNCQDLSKSAFSGWGVGGCAVVVVVVQTNSTQSAKICPNLHFQGGGGGPDQLNPKCQDLPKSAFGGEGAGLVVVQTNSIQSAKICIFRGGCGPDQLNPKCQDLSKSTFGGGAVVVQTNSTQSAKICPNLHFQGGGGVGGSDQHS